MPYKPKSAAKTNNNERPTLPIQFDYDRLHKIMKDRGGVELVCKEAGFPDATFYYLKKYSPLPLPRKLRDLIAELKLPLSVVRSLFIEIESPNATNTNK